MWSYVLGQKKSTHRQQLLFFRENDNFRKSYSTCLHSYFIILPWVFMRFLRCSLISFLKIYENMNDTIFFFEVFQPPNGLTGRNFCILIMKIYLTPFWKKYWSPNPRLEICRDHNDGRSCKFFVCCVIFSSAFSCIICA